MKMSELVNVCRNPAHGVLWVCLIAVSGCSDPYPEQPDVYDELAPYYMGEKIADYPEEMAEYREAFENGAMPFVTATGHVGPTALLDSKLLGQPYLPKGFEYPRDPNGKPLRLLAQINFADVPALEGYPDEGILQFYISDDPGGYDLVQVWGLQFYMEEPYDAQAQLDLWKSQDYFRVVWHETVEENAGPSEFDIRFDPDGMMPADEEARLTFETGMSYPVPGDYRFARVFGKGDYEFFEQFGDKEESVAVRYISHITVDDIAWIGGYAFFTQGDPREIVPDEDWLLLFELQSSMTEDQPSVMWGDVGIGAFFIRPEDLRNRDFSNVLYTWDSH